MHQLEKFIDRHLLPYLLVPTTKKKSLWKPLVLWSCVWTGLVLALAGPRWDYREMETFSRDQQLVILLDLSKSMTASDIPPSRLIRAKQKIEDLLKASQGTKIGLIAFAADPHMIAPITDDLKTIQHLLPSLDHDLVHVQGSRLSSALNMASTMFEAEPGNNKAILIISDGGFEDASAITTSKKLADRGIVIYTMGIGTAQGAPLKDLQGNVLKKNGAPVLSKLEKDKLYEISKIGNGRYLEADYTGQSETYLLQDLEKRSELQLNISKKNRLWNEYFYLALFPILPIVLIWFRKGALIVFPWILLSHSALMDASLSDYFINPETHAKKIFDASEYEAAAQEFEDPYRKGVSYYKAGDFAKAEEMFRLSSRPEIASNAHYNLGNALALQEKLDEAIAAYEEVLKEWPDHTKAKENLEILKKLKEQQQNQESQEQKKENQNQNSENQKDSQQNQNSQEKQENHDSSSDQQKNDPNSSQKQQQDPSNQQENQEAPPEPQNTSSEQEEKAKEEQTEAQISPTEEEKLEKQSSDSSETEASLSQEDLDANLWLDQIKNEPKTFLKNKFYLESKRNGTTQGIDPW
ncbi:MAG: VWA domain-containing protein, partial [Parachlamydiaceae bacterium]